MCVFVRRRVLRKNGIIPKKIQGRQIKYRNTYDISGDNNNKLDMNYATDDRNPTVGLSGWRRVLVYNDHAHH